MKKVILSFCFIGVIIFNANSQLVVDNTTLSPEQLIQTVLVGTGVTVSNVTYNGSLPDALIVQAQAGQFSGTSSIGIPSGILLGTGDVTVAIGPNTLGSASAGGTGLSGSDPDLNSISSASIYDQCVIEFDFVPSGDSIKFNYSFGSEEYLEFCFAGYNDAFGFFLSGPGISGPYSGGAVNLAVIPGTSTPVTIDNVNSTVNPAYYVNNETPPGLTIQYDGYTTVLQASAAVQCGQTYHIKLAIGDAGDGVWDSGVFIEGGSFSSNEIDVTIATPTSTSFINGSIYEGCAIGTTATFYLVRPDDSVGDTISFSYSGSATLGIDYSSSTPDTLVIFPAGQDSASFGVTILNDGIPEGLDSLVVTVFNINVCGDTIISSATLYINDPLVIICDIPDDTINCPNTLVNLFGNASGSPLPMTYQWTGPGLSDTSLNTSITANGGETIIFTATDQCLFSGSDTMNIVYIPIPITANAGINQTLSCPNDNMVLSGSVTDGFAPYNYTWTSGSTTILSTATGPYTPLTTQTIVLSVTDNCGISDTDTMTVTVPVFNPFNLTYPTADSVICAGDVSNLTVIVNSGGFVPYNYLWTNADVDSSTSYTVFTSPTLAGITITDACGYDTTLVIPLTIIASNPLTITATDGELCFTTNNLIEIPISTTGGTGSNSYIWSGPIGTTVIAGSNGSGTVSNAIDGIYIVVVTDYCGNIAIDTADIIAIPCEITIPNIVTPNGDGTNDAIKIENLEYHPNTYFGLFNRWGQLMYENGNYQNDYQPTDLSDGVYFYILKLTDGTSPADYHGQIHVIKKR